MALTGDINQGFSKQDDGQTRHSLAQMAMTWIVSSPSFSCIYSPPHLRI